MLWAALLLPPPPSGAPPTPEALRGLACWALQFTPRVAVHDGAVLLELAASVRLWGGGKRLAQRLRAACPGLGVSQLSWAPTGLGALALARAGVPNGWARPWPALLDALPLECLSALQPHRPVLARLGCQRLGQVRALPRSGVSRRFATEVLTAIDQAYGQQPEGYPWMQLPETFQAKLELMARVECAEHLLFGARRLLMQLTGWLAARQRGVTAFRLGWQHDSLSSSAAGDGGELVVRTAQPSRDLAHLSRLLAEHLAHVQLLAPVGNLELSALEDHLLAPPTLALLPSPQQAQDDVRLTLERLAARLGANRVLRPVIQADHRPEHMCAWQPASAALPRRPAPLSPWPQPSFLLPTPLRLHTRHHRPVYQGSLQLLLGPHRIEGGWWDRSVATTGQVARDYWVAQSAHAGLLWVFQTRPGDGGSASSEADSATAEPTWFLHGHFA